MEASPACAGQKVIQEFSSLVRYSRTTGEFSSFLVSFLSNDLPVVATSGVSAPSMGSVSSVLFAVTGFCELSVEISRLLFLPPVLPICTRHKIYVGPGHRQFG